MDTYRALNEADDQERAVRILKQYLNRLPSDRLAMFRLFEAYLALGKKVLAWEFASQHLPMLQSVDQVVSYVSEYERQRMAGRRDFFRRRLSFARNDAVTLRILSPQDGQMIGGSDVVPFDFEGVHRPFFRADLYLNDDWVGFVECPPYQIPVSFDRDRRYQTLKVVAYFEDETFVEHSVGVKTLPIDAQEAVQIHRLRAVVTHRNNKFRTDLGKEDFVLKEYGKRIGIRDLKLEKEPLNIALLVDTSSSMMGTKILRAQNAVHHFLSNLDEKDKVSIYTFDQRVMRLNDLSTNRQAVQPCLFTLHPMFGTALYDAIFIAHETLRKETGTRVIVLLSDGIDSASEVSAEVVQDILLDSPIMVYCVVLTRDRMDREAESGKSFLHEIARLSGSAALDVADTRHLKRAFRQVCDELKSFYYLDYYSEKEAFDLDSIELDTVNRGLKTRFRRLIY